MKRLFALFILCAYLSIPARPNILGGGPTWSTAPPNAGCAQATTYLARTTGGNEGGNVANMTAFICGLVTDGVITGNLSTTGCGTTLDALYVFAQQNSADSFLNLCDTSYTITQGGTNTFTSYVGWNGFNTSGGSLDTNFNSTTATSPNYTQNSASFGFWSVAVTNEAIAEMGTSNTGATGESNIYDHYTDGDFYVRANNGTLGGVSSPGTKGLFVADRPNSSNIIPYWDGISQGTQTVTSQAPYNGVFFIGVSLTGSSSNQQFAEAHIGASLGATLNLALYSRLRTYMTAVGVP